MQVLVHSSAKHLIFRDLARHSTYSKRHILNPSVTIVACNSSLTNCNHIQGPLEPLYNLTYKKYASSCIEVHWGIQNLDMVNLGVWYFCLLARFCNKNYEKKYGEILSNFNVKATKMLYTALAKMVKCDLPLRNLLPHSYIRRNASS